MRYYSPRQRISDQKWEYACGSHPTGYCAPYKTLDPALHFPESVYDKMQETAHKHHTDGHDTKEEACLCYRNYLLDHHLRFDKMSNQQLRCEVCKEYTEGYAQIEYKMIVLCDKHRNRESVEEIFKTAAEESWVS